MQTVSLSSPSLSPATNPKPNLDFRRLSFPARISGTEVRTSTKAGTFRASETIELFPSTYTDVVVREARMEDSWEVAETHCSCFFPNYSFPLDFLLRINRLVGLLSGFSAPDGCMRTCLVAIVGSSLDGNTFSRNDCIRFGDLGFDRGHIAGILTVDTMADFLPRKGVLRQRRTGIAYISNVAVRQQDRRKGIAKKLIVKAEALARSWDCRAIALHCDANNPGATKLYLGQGFKCIKVPEQAKWPQPSTSPSVRFNFMMKLLSSAVSNNTL
ncbi:hypothetical protein H6P81_011723 [Aristolochia fimbriata]|uniref:N-acetyltransferase domain-containing protein n=1 Tax=Aristolochia fimbriata TaxID=158543 RepID=A0AAV7E9S4_ARIFI|nr:hypothetical protein H6P81_011723 [Aristolochia fimbriata]